MTIMAMIASLGDRVDEAPASGAVDSSLIPIEVKPQTL